MSVDRDDVTMSRKPLATVSTTRKSNKPLMEKRRRERINVCLDQLKAILMDVTKKESSYYSKLEKADILELTVKYLRNIKRPVIDHLKSLDDHDVIVHDVSASDKCYTTSLSGSNEYSRETREQKPEVTIQNKILDAHSPSLHLSSCCDNNNHGMASNTCHNSSVKSRPGSIGWNELQTGGRVGCAEGRRGGDGRGRGRVERKVDDENLDPDRSLFRNIRSESLPNAKENVVWGHQLLSVTGQNFGIDRKLLGVELVPAKLPDGQLVLILADPSLTSPDNIITHFENSSEDRRNSQPFRSEDISGDWPKTALENEGDADGSQRSGITSSVTTLVRPRPLSSRRDTVTSSGSVLERPVVVNNSRNIPMMWNNAMQSASSSFSSVLPSINVLQRTLSSDRPEMPEISSTFNGSNCDNNNDNNDNNNDNNTLVAECDSGRDDYNDDENNDRTKYDDDDDSDRFVNRRNDISSKLYRGACQRLLGPCQASNGGIVPARDFLEAASSGIFRREEKNETDRFREEERSCGMEQGRTRHETDRLSLLGLQNQRLLTAGSESMLSDETVATFATRSEWLDNNDGFRVRNPAVGKRVGHYHTGCNNARPRSDDAWGLVWQEGGSAVGGELAQSRGNSGGDNPVKVIDENNNSDNKNSDKIASDSVSTNIDMKEDCCSTDRGNREYLNGLYTTVDRCDRPVSEEDNRDEMVWRPW